MSRFSRPVVAMAVACAATIGLTVGGCSTSSTSSNSATSATASTVAPANTAAGPTADEIRFCAEVTTNLDALRSKEVNAVPQFIAALAKLQAVAPAEVKADLAAAQDGLGAIATQGTSQNDATEKSLARLYFYISRKCSLEL